MKIPFAQLWRRLRGKAEDASPAKDDGLRYGHIDAYRRQRVPSPADLLFELKNVVYTCASINAAVCASYPPHLYVTTAKNEPEPKCLTADLSTTDQKSLRGRIALSARQKNSRIQEVLDHPILDLFKSVNQHMTAFDLWELTTFYQETVGAAYWNIERSPIGVPNVVWPLPSQYMTPKRKPGSNKLVDFYEYKSGAVTRQFAPEDIIHFRYPDPRDPYTHGLSPLRATFEMSSMSSEYVAFKNSTWKNSAIPGVVISPDEVIGEEERDRLEEQWNQKFRVGGAAKALVAESGMKVSVLSHSMGDLAALAEHGATKTDIANAFHVPLSYLSTETNLANLQAAERQHKELGIAPRLKRRDEKLNQQLVPQFDTSGRLFLASDDPTPIDVQFGFKQREQDLKYGVTTINEQRSVEGLEPVSWGNMPWLPINLAPVDFPHRQAYAPNAGRNKLPQEGSIQVHDEEGD